MKKILALLFFALVLLSVTAVSAEENVAFLADENAVDMQEIMGDDSLNLESDGEYNLTIGDYSTIVTVNNGVGQFNAGIFDAGDYTVVANYSGDANHKSNSSSFDVRIDKYIPTLSLDIPEIDYGDVGIISVFCDVAGTVNVTVNGITETLDLHGETIRILFASFSSALSSGYDAALHLYNLDAGTYPVTVTYDGDNNYESPSVSGELKVNSVNATMDVETSDISVGEDEKITVTLPSDATGTVTVTVDGKEYSAEVKDGKAVISVPGLSAGSKEAKISYSGDNNYNPAEDTVSFDVNKVKADMSAESNDPIDDGESLHIVVNLPKDATGTVTVTVDSKEYSAEVKDGKAVFDIPGLPPGTYDVTVKYSGDDKYEPDEYLLSVTVNKKANPDNPSDVISGDGMAVKVVGNPIMALLFALMAVCLTAVRRFK